MQIIRISVGCTKTPKTVEDKMSCPGALELELMRLIQSTIADTKFHWMGYDDFMGTGGAELLLRVSGDDSNEYGMTVNIRKFPKPEHWR